ncbi:UNVERIFIED_CONTAM: hypothetical protein Sindi_0382200 [Sesamum indicum]
MAPHFLLFLISLIILPIISFGYYADENTLDVGPKFSASQLGQNPLLETDSNVVKKGHIPLPIEIKSRSPRGRRPIKRRPPPRRRRPRRSPPPPPPPSDDEGGDEGSGDEGSGDEGGSNHGDFRG